MIEIIIRQAYGHVLLKKHNSECVELMGGAHPSNSFLILSAME